MDLLSILILAVVQGLTEFLPVSSSGHLALVEHWLQVPEEARLSVTVFLHLGTLVALLIYFRDELGLMVKGVLQREKAGLQLLGYVLLANLGTASLALSLEQLVEQVFATPQFVGVFLVVTALLLFASEQWSKQRLVHHPLTWQRALLVGIAQGLAVFPGLSRSGTTIAAGLCCGLSREQAGRFAFVVSIPAMIGANLVEAKELSTLAIDGGTLVLATLVAFGSGYLAIHWALAAVRRLQLRWFSLYCLFVAVAAWLTG